MNYRARKGVSGQVLIEALIAAGVLTVGFLGILTLLNRSLGLNRVIADNYTGSYLAAEGIELVKNFIDTNAVYNGVSWNTGIRDGHCYEVDSSTRDTSDASWKDLGVCSDSSLSDGSFFRTSARPLKFDFEANPKAFRYSGSFGGDASGSTFYRIIKIVQLDDDMRVNSHVRWYTRAGGTFFVNVEDHFYNRF